MTPRRFNIYIHKTSFMKQAELIRIKCRDYSQTKDIQDV